MRNYADNLENGTVLGNDDEERLSQYDIDLKIKTTREIISGLTRI